jgi:hypothetical protein
MDAPVAMKSSLHNALMRLASGDFFFAYADPDGSAAWNERNTVR